MQPIRSCYGRREVHLKPGICHGLPAKSTLDLQLTTQEYEKYTVPQPLPHRHSFSSRSNSANPPRTVTNRPWGVVVSAQASASDLKVAPASPTTANTFSRSLVDRASLSSRVTVNVSPGPSSARALASARLSVLAPLTFSEHSLTANSRQLRQLCLQRLPIGRYSGVANASHLALRL
jgi:hypothetical protein